MKCKCLKWARIAHLDIYSISYGQKKGRESNWQFDSRPLKVGNRPDFLACRLQGLQLCFRPHRNRRSEQEVMRPQSRGSPSYCNFETPRTKSHLNVAPVERCRVYYKGEGGGFPQVRAVVSLMCPCCPWLVLAGPCE